MHHQLITEGVKEFCVCSTANRVEIGTCGCLDVLENNSEKGIAGGLAQGSAKELATGLAKDLTGGLTKELAEVVAKEIAKRLAD